jgi:hypothetical protein
MYQCDQRPEPAQPKAEGSTLVVQHSPNRYFRRI